MVRCLLALLMFALGACSSSKPTVPPAPVATVVYVVRHAEKGTTPPQDPPLSPAGEARAQALLAELKNEPISVIYTSNTTRTRSTVAPLAAAKQLAPVVYDPLQPAELARQIQEQPRGKTILVVGHSNTVLETIEALGAPRPVPQLTDADYNYLFKVTLPATGAATATASRYGG
jgi:broad specificity phosphatase PhoE